MGSETIADLVRRRQARSRRLLQEVAAEVGVHRSTLSRWMAGAVDPLPWHVPPLARALGVPRRRVEAAIAAAREARITQEVS